MRQNTLVTLGASVTFGLLAVYMARGWINEAIESEYDTPQPHVETIMEQTWPETTPVLVMNMDVGFGTELTADHMRVVEYPIDILPEGTYSSFNDLFVSPNEKTIVLSGMTHNEPILDYKVSGPRGRGSMSALITEGMRAVSIYVNDVAGVAGFVVPGDHVDIIYSRHEDKRRQDSKVTSYVLLQNVKVLGTDQNLDDTTNEADVAKTVTLEVTPQDAQKLHIALDAGKLSLSLRRYGDIASATTTPINHTHLLGSNNQARQPRKYNQKTNVKPKTLSNTIDITIVRGDDRDLVKAFRDETDSTTQLAGG